MENISLNDKILQVLRNARLIILDNNAYIYLNSERQDDIKKYGIGSGIFTSAISLFALLNLLSKMHTILKNGEKKVTTKTHLEEYELIKSEIQINNSGRWKTIKKYLKKPRIGEINETDAFAEFIIDLPFNIGLDKTNSEEIKKIWNFFRNKLTHMISLKGNELNGQMLIQTNILGGDYQTNLEFLKNRNDKYKAFDIPKLEMVEKFKNFKHIDNETLQYIIKDKCYVDQLKISCDQILTWLIDKIKNQEFPTENIIILDNWLNDELK
jgi:hypothetical protein